MRRSILTIGLALLLSFTAVMRPVSAADMPLKAPPPPVVVPVEVFCWPCLLLAAGIIAGVICAVECHGHGENPGPVTHGAPDLTKS